MLKNLFIASIIGFGALAFHSCNSDSDSQYTYEESSAVAVTAFSLNDNKKVLDSLSNVFFSIDLVSANIFNADSLPYGTNVSRLVPSITASSGASLVQLEFPRPGKSDSIVNYLTNSTDSIDFSNGPVKLRVRSQSGAVERVYTVKVNVHAVKPDSLCWKEFTGGNIAWQHPTLAARGAARCGDTFYVLSAADNGSAYEMLSSTDAFTENSASVAADFSSFTPDVESLTGTDEALYILASDGRLMKYATGGNWSDTGSRFHALYGAYGNEVLGSVNDESGWHIKAYPSGKTYSLPAGCPVEATSQLCLYTLPMAESPMAVMLGGRTVEGSLSAKAWGFDGSTWAMISTKTIPDALEDVVLADYDLFNVPSSTWSPVKFPALVAFGGRRANGSVNRTVYYTYDLGMTWRKAPELMQLPSDVPSFYGNRAFVFATTSKAKSRSSMLSCFNVKGLPAGAMEIMPVRSRASEPITEWEVPAIYFFGGHYASGDAIPATWRARLIRYTFKPVQ